ncbi:hypothetical protein D0Z03_000957 [Geotrichum reessii]|nr:hypothetical protein D0Z03_000957 [Galactomyces reessii]
MGPYLESVDDIKKGKIQEFYKTAEVKAKPPKVVATVAPAKKKSLVPSESGLSRKSSSASKSSEKSALKKVLSPLKHALQSKQSLARRSLSSSSSVTAESPASQASLPQRQIQRPSVKPSPMTTSSPTPVEPVEEPRQQSSVQQSFSFPPEKQQQQQQQQQQQSQQPLQSYSYLPQPPVNTSSAEDQALIAKLRSENEALKAELQSTSASRTKLLEDLHALQTKLTGLLEAHTHDVLQIKSKETQLVRAQSDLEIVKVQLELEVEKRKNLMYTNANSEINTQVLSHSPPLPPVIVPRPQPPQQHLQHQAIPQQQHYFNDDSVLDHLGHSPFVSESEIPKRARPMSYHPDSSPMGLGGFGSGIPSFSGGFSGGNNHEYNGNSSPGLGSPNSRGSNWKRAAEVTVQLKARIEAMKARQNKPLGEAI